MSRAPARSRGARARRALVVDGVAAAILAAVALSVAAGLGVVAFFALPILLVGLLWIGVEAGLSRLRRPTVPTASAGPRPNPSADRRSRPGAKPGRS